MIRDVAEVLAYAHQRGVIHGGITPDRLVVAGRDRGFPMCITDWSAARAHDAEAIAVGDPTPFTAPELVAGDTIDDRADVFALGVVAYRALTGELSERAKPVPTEVHCPEVPRELTRLVDQMLAPDRWDRPSAAEVRAELGFLASRSRRCARRRRCGFASRGGRRRSISARSCALIPRQILASCRARATTSNS